MNASVPIRSEIKGVWLSQRDRSIQSLMMSVRWIILKGEGRKGEREINMEGNLGAKKRDRNTE